MTRYPTQTWPAVVAAFAGLADVPALAPLARAVEQIAVSRYAAALFPVKSMHTLLLYQHPTAGPEDERLVLAHEDGELVLRFERGQLAAPPASLRTTVPEWETRGLDALTLLGRAADQLRWFVEYGAPAV